MINDRDGDAAQRTASQIDGESTVFAGDLTEGDSPDELVKTAVDAWGRIDIIVNNAGYTLDAPVHMLSDVSRPGLGGDLETRIMSCERQIPRRDGQTEEVPR